MVSLKGEGQGAMVSEHMKNSTFHKMPEARYTARSSLSKVLYCVLAGCSFLEK